MKSAYRDHFKIVIFSEREDKDSSGNCEEMKTVREFFGKFIPMRAHKIVEGKNVEDNFIITHMVECHYDDVADLLDYDSGRNSGCEYMLIHETCQHTERYRIRQAGEDQNRRRIYKIAAELDKREVV